MSDRATSDEVEDLSLVCDAQAFCPVLEHTVRWLDWDDDYQIATTAFQRDGLSREDWSRVRGLGFEYCAVLEGDQAVARAAVWRGVPSADRRWEVAAVWTREDRRGCGMAKSTVSFVSEHILATGRVATLHTQPTNVAMLRAATSVGFKVVESHEVAW